MWGGVLLLNQRRGGNRLSLGCFGCASSMPSAMKREELAGLV